MAELQAGVTHSWRVDQRQETCRIGPEQPVEERFVSILQGGEENVFLEIGRFLIQLLQNSLYLNLFTVDALRQQANQPQRLALGLAEGGRLVEMRIA